MFPTSWNCVGIATDYTCTVLATSTMSSTTPDSFRLDSLAFGVSILIFLQAVIVLRWLLSIFTGTPK